MAYLPRRKRTEVTAEPQATSRQMSSTSGRKRKMRAITAVISSQERVTSVHPRTFDNPISRRDSRTFCRMARPALAAIEASTSRPTPRISPKQSSRRSEEHTSELQSRPHLVCRLLLEKKKKKTQKTYIQKHPTQKL